VVTMSRLEPYLPVVTALLALIGFLTLSSAVTDQQDLTRQAVYFVVGLVGCVALFWLGPARIDRLTVPLYLVTLLLLVLVLVFGEEVNGAKRWLEFGPVRLQPSEVAKVAIILLLARSSAGRRACASGGTSAQRSSSACRSCWCCSDRTWAAPW
jgi:rod shape determining protein RodA